MSNVITIIHVFIRVALISTTIIAMIRMMVLFLSSMTSIRFLTIASVITKTFYCPYLFLRLLLVLAIDIIDIMCYVCVYTSHYCYQYCFHTAYMSCVILIFSFPLKLPKSACGHLSIFGS